MRKYQCPDCGRHLFESDAPPGYTVRVPRCAECRKAKLVRTQAAESEPTKPPRGRWPNPLRYR